MSRKISITRIHAINWYGYRDSFDVAGNLLIAGVTGSGKSVLMDLVQFVLVADQRKTRYNQSATGERSTRDLIGYCLGDLKHEVDGARQYMRPRGGITYVALEFTWPNRKRVETWGLRIEFDSAARNTPSRMEGFFVPTSLERSDLLHHELDGQRRPLDLAAFRQVVATPRGKEGKIGAIFPTLDTYRREMALPSHLNFDRGTLDYLLPAAMSFTFMDNFNKFCREFILPAEQVDIQSVKDSYRVFRSLQADLALLREQQERLEHICGLAQERATAEADRHSTRFLEGELRRDAAVQRLEALKQEFKDLEEALASERVREEELKLRIETASTELGTLETAMRETEEGRLFRHLQDENRTLAAKIARAKESGTKIESALQNRAVKAARFAEMAAALPFPIDAGAVKGVRAAGEYLADSPREKTRETLLRLSEAVKTLLRAGRDAIAPKQRENEELEKELAGFHGQLTMMREGRLSQYSTLLDALNARLLKTGSTPPARALRQLCEVTDEDWRPALEVSFSRKFAVVVDRADYQEAERIYHELRADAPGESLVNPDRISTKAAAQRGSLAEKLETSHPVARAIVDSLFGDVICVTRLEDMRKHPRAIMPDGFQIRGAFVERPRHYDNQPCIGDKGLSRLRAWLQEKMDEIRARQALLEPALHAWRDLQAFASQTRLESETVEGDLSEVALLPELESRLAKNIATLSEIRSEDLEEQERRAAQLRDELQRLKGEERELLRSERRHRLQELYRAVDEACLNATRAEDRFREIAVSLDVSPYLPRLDHLREEIIAAYPLRDAAADHCKERYYAADKKEAQAGEALLSARRELAAAPTYGSRYTSFDPAQMDNTPWDKQLEKIQAGDIPEYQQKARSEERNWQQLFRTQVLEKLREKLLDVETLMALLETQLREPIGNSKYRIKAAPNMDQEYVLYRRLLDAAAVSRADDLLFATEDAEIREAVEDLFNRLIERGDDPQALAFLDYRNYFDYDMLVSDTRDPDGRASSLNKHSGKFSGGENQTPYFIAILACYLRAYQRHARRRSEPSLSVVPIDEAFSKLSGERIRDCIGALHKLDLQGVFSMSSGNIPYAIDQVDQVISVSAQPEIVGGRKMVRNVAVTLTREDATKRFSGTR